MTCASKHDQTRRSLKGHTSISFFDSAPIDEVDADAPSGESVPRYSANMHPTVLGRARRIAELVSASPCSLSTRRAGGERVAYVTLPLIHLQFGGAALRYVVLQSGLLIHIDKFSETQDQGYNWDASLIENSGRFVHSLLSDSFLIASFFSGT
jgi:hypothetical protein